MKKGIILFVLNIFVIGGTLLFLSAEPGVSIDNFSLIDHQGKFHRLFDYADSRGVVIYSHGVGCPIVRHNLVSLKKIRDEYNKKGFTFFLLNMNPQDDRETILEEAEEFKIDIPILHDESQLIGEMLKFTRTAEALLIRTDNWTISYRGPLDDRLDYEAQKAVAKQEFLVQALEAELTGKEISLDSVPVVKGCLINKNDVLASRERKISYVNDVVPILRTRCIPCHRKNGIAPWAMSSHRRVKGWSPMMREVILIKRMPPWHADPEFGEFSNDRSLSVSEMRTLVHWIDGGAVKDGEEDPLANQPKSSEEWQLGKPDLVLTLPTQKIPATGALKYIYVGVDNPLDKDVWVRGADIQPSNRKVMHHALTLLKYPKDIRNQQPEWDGGGNGFFSVYVPGYNSPLFPGESGQWLPKGGRFVFQLHYTPIGVATTDTPQMALYFHDKKPEEELKIMSAVNYDFFIPPYAEDHPVEASYEFDKDVFVYSFLPHMHFRGKTMKFTALYSDGSQKVLLSVPNYQFNWQTPYRFEKRTYLPAGTKILCSGSFDNSDKNPQNPDPAKEVDWGDQSWDEMFIGYIRYTEK